VIMLKRTGIAVNQWSRVPPPINSGSDGGTARPAFPIAPESLALAALCLLDLATTLHWVSRHGAAEGNPLMAWFLTHGGIPAFVLAKCALLIVPLSIMEWARRRRPRFVHTILRCGIAAYIALYGFGVRHINSEMIVVAERINAAAAHPINRDELKNIVPGQTAVWHWQSDSLRQRSSAFR
jgi:hypothetical protein